MIDLLRRFSQARRVSFGFGALSLGGTGLGGWAAARFHDLGQPDLAWNFGLSAGALMVVGLIAGWAVSVSIKAPVEDTAMAVMRIAKGDLETRIESPGRDELSWLRSELDRMRRKLRDTVQNVRQPSEDIGAAAVEIARDNNDLSVRTLSQAQELDTTRQAMESLATTVRAHATSASGASTEMEQVRTVAQRGGQMMTDVVQRMAGIAESAGRIGEIIGVIDGIAFQTNILALNAAVEAARAGEQGRGFAVVASEVRALAQRSATAAREIKDLIGDSTDKVKAGSQLVGEAGTTMRQLVEQVTRVTGKVTEMAEVGAQQSDSIDSVNRAIVRLEEVTRQNAALVEKVSGTSQDLRGHSEQMRSAVRMFQVKGLMTTA